ncbi:MAG: glutamate racemase [Planctomycetes bacterium]|nr:glutamate racemase [Planctomycetota bacterium]
MNASRPICFYDSGIGGLSVWRETASMLPEERLLYLADHAHLPYGPRPLEEVRSLAEGVVRFFQGCEAKLVVLACNSASAAALYYLRGKFPQLPFIGMEPAVKPAVEQTRSKIVGVLATEATFQGELFAALMQRFGKDARIIEQPCPGLVELIESGKGASIEAEKLLRERIEPLVKAGIDLLVLGCTHYIFSIDLIRRIVGNKITVLNPAEAVSRRVKQVLTEGNLLACGIHHEEPVFYTTGNNLAAYQEQVTSLCGLSSPSCRQLHWQGRSLLA